MQYRLLHEDRGQRTFAVILQTGDEAMSCLQAFAEKEKIAAAQLTAIGAFREARLAYFDWDAKSYQPIPVARAGRGCLSGRRYCAGGRQTERPRARRSRQARRNGFGRTPAGRSCATHARGDRDRAAGASVQGQGCRKRARVDQSARRSMNPRAPASILVSLRVRRYRDHMGPAHRILNVEQPAPRLYHRRTPIRV